MGYDDLLNAVKVHPTKTAFSKRFINFLQARLPQDVINAVNYNVIEYQRKNGTLRISRVVPEKKKKMSNKAYHERDHIIMMNASDKKVLDQLAAFKAENSLDMGDTADQWFEYITTGKIGSEVHLPLGKNQSDFGD